MVAVTLLRMQSMFLGDTLSGAGLFDMVGDVKGQRT